MNCVDYSFDYTAFLLVRELLIDRIFPMHHEIG